MIKQTAIDRNSRLLIENQKLLIGGDWVAPLHQSSLEVVSPIDGARLCSIAAGGDVDVDKAVSDSRAALQKTGWASLAPAERKRVLFRIAELIDQHEDELAVLGVRDNGTEMKMAYRAEPKSASASFRFYAEAIDKRFGELAPTAVNVLAMVEPQPIGVVGVIVPWNFPLMIASWKIAAALAAGNSVVVKPSELASLSLLRLGALALEAGLPPGVLNIVTGTGQTAGRALALHREVDALAFTGSGAVGRKLLEYSAKSNIKPVYLELGGKSPNIIFKDYRDTDNAVEVAVRAMFRNSGQVCIAGSRLLVERTIYADVLAACVDLVKTIRVGNPLDLDTEMGAVISEQQLSKNLSYVNSAVEEGAELCFGGHRTLSDSGGYYMEPTILGRVDNQMRVAQEEVFGPILCVIPFEDEEDAVRIANESTMGLSAGVWTDNLSRAHRMVRAVQAGIVHVNCYGGSDLTVPLGGIKQSGTGYDKSMHALEKFSKLKSAWIQLDSASM